MTDLAADTGLTTWQQEAFDALLAGKIWTTGRGGGKTFLRRRIIEHLMAQERTESSGVNQWRLVEL